MSVRSARRSMAFRLGLLVGIALALFSAQLMIAHAREAPKLRPLHVKEQAQHEFDGSANEAHVDRVETQQHKVPSSSQSSMEKQHNNPGILDVSTNGTTSSFSLLPLTGSCSALKDCTTCAGTQGCTWCPSSSTCMANGAFCETSEIYGGPVWAGAQYCACTNPTSSYSSCEDCMAFPCQVQYEYNFGYLGWCPTESKCYWGSNTSQPLNHTCAANSLEGAYQANSLQACNCVYPAQKYQNCSACNDFKCYVQYEWDYGYLGWCPGENLCLYGLNNSMPIDHQCVANETVGMYVSNNDIGCNCINPTETFSNCSSCLDFPCFVQYDYYFGYLGWCPSEGKCYWGSNVTSPLNHQCIASEENGTYVSGNTVGCSCINPLQNFMNCSECLATSCTASYDYYFGYLGWCPSENACYWGTNASSPLSHKCLSTTFDGEFSTNPQACACMNPSNLTTCSTCIPSTGACSNGWCSSTNECSYTDNGNIPPDTSCPPTTAMGEYTTTCACAYAQGITVESTCWGCGYTYCLDVEPQYCLYGVNNTDPCPPANCDHNCYCVPNSNTTCDTCRVGFSNITNGCTYKCTPNCYDCSPFDNAQCLSTCAPGFTNFPACDEFCPPECFMCGASYVNSTTPSSECIWCVDGGAVAPDCTQCLPSLCKDSTGACSVPCNTNIPQHYLDETLGDNPSYAYCEGCQQDVGDMFDMLQTVRAVQADIKEAQETLAAFEFLCLSLTVLIPPIGAVCDGYVLTLEGISEAIVGVITMLVSDAFFELLSDNTCYQLGLCPNPCDAKRGAALANRTASAMSRPRWKKLT